MIMRTSSAATTSGLLGFFIYHHAAVVTTAAFSLPESLMQPKTRAVPTVRLHAYGPRDQYRDGRHSSDPGMDVNGEYPQERMSAPMVPHNEYRNQAIKPLFGGNVQGGGSRKTWANANDVNLESDGRPIDAEVEWWDGPDNAPMRMRVYSEDGYSRPVRVVSELSGGGPYDRGHSVSVQNTGPLEYPISAGVGAGQERAAVTGGGSTYAARSQKIQGEGSIATFPFDESVQSLEVTLWSEGRPINALIELLQGPGNVRTVADVYNEGTKGPFTVVVDTPGPSGVLQIENTGPMTFPINARVEPSAYGNGGDSNYYGYGGMYSAPNNTPLN